MAESEFDLVVIGGGSGGVRAARLAAQTGATVALIEEYRLGGTCVIRGCVPKKFFVYAARFADEFALAESFGWQVQASFDWSTLKANKDREIARLEGIYGTLLQNSNVEVFADRGILEDAHTIRLKKSGARLKAKTILIATGGHPYKPEIEGAVLGLTSNEMFELEQLPQSILVQGGGYIAVEFATIMAGLGVKTTLVYRGGNILRGFDEDIRDGLREAMISRGVDFRFDQVIERLEHAQGGGVRAQFSTGHAHTYGAVLFATGRLPNTKGLGLEAAGVELNERGAVVVDRGSQSTVPHIHAVGDVIGRAELTPVAIREGAAFVETVFKNNPTTLDYGLIPTAVFSEPEIGTIGLTEEQAPAASPDFDVYVAKFRPMANTLSDRQERMVIKLITMPDEGVVMGCHILGPGAGEMIQLVAIPMAMNATKADFDRAIAVHPTAAEELVTFKAPSYRYRGGVKQSQ